MSRLPGLLLERGHGSEHDARLRGRVRPPVWDRARIGDGVAGLKFNSTLAMHDGERAGLDDDAFGSQMTERLALVCEARRQRAANHLQRRPPAGREELTHDELAFGLALKDGKQSALVGAHDKVVAVCAALKKTRDRDPERLGEPLQCEERWVAKPAFKLADQTEADARALAQRIQAQSLSLALVAQLATQRGDLGVRGVSFLAHTHRLISQPSGSHTGGPER